MAIRFNKELKKCLPSIFDNLTDLYSYCRQEGLGEIGSISYLGFYDNYEEYIYIVKDYNHKTIGYIRDKK